MLPCWVWRWRKWLWTKKYRLLLEAGKGRNRLYQRAFPLCWCRLRYAVFCLAAQLCLTSCDPMDCSPARHLCPWGFSRKNTRVGFHALLQGISPTQESNPGLLHCRWILYLLSCQGSPRTPERVAYPFSRGSSWPRYQTKVSCIAGRFFTSWATREPLLRYGRAENSIVLYNYD